jgi:hypothetical protein
MAFSEKPKGMQWKSYDGPKERSGVMENHFNAGLAFQMARLTGLFE